jgi:Protein of unknown function (DUF1553)/Protein of unknown function (DUF1549)/Concanavalin A-like lectin/glucanases superfamily
LKSATGHRMRLAIFIFASVALAQSVSAAEPSPRAGRDWWSLQPIERPALPPIINQKSPIINPIDLLVIARLQAEGLTMAAPADRATLIRRLTYDLHGLPPTPEELQAFSKDESPNAYEKLVDRLLASPRYGERWGRHWLDVARFSESQGFERDKIRDHAWRYRDYVIASFNSDKPYDQFVREQIAGDMLPGATRDSVVATGFLVAGPFDEAGNSSVSELLRLKIREEELEDMLSAVSQTFLGLTANCARCHDHKFDSIPQRDYYRLKSVFDGVRHGDRPLLPEVELHRRRELLAKLDASSAECGRKLAALEWSARQKLAGEKFTPLPAALTMPIARWTFESDARDSIGSLHASLRGPARLASGRLILSGKGAFAETVPLAHDLREKTLEAWVSLPHLKQGGGGVISVQVNSGGQFDAIVFGEREPGKWFPGSEGFRRTRNLDAAAETAGPNDLIHVALVYSRNGSIAMYRNGKLYGKPYKPEVGLQTYAAGTSQVLFGLRHTGAGNGFLTGEIEEARLYDRAMNAQEVAASFKAGVTSISREEMVKALSPQQRAEFDLLSQEMTALRAERARIPTETKLVYAANSKQPEPTHVLLRGDVEKKDEVVSAGGLSAIRSLPADLGLAPNAPEGERRVRFANWLANPANPLTSRVIVNRVWHYHFGRGLVDTPNDFGFNGGRPSHPELLDWLADELRTSGWSLKSLHRLILTSATYRQSGRFNADAAAKDADNRLLWRFAPRRLEAEAVRDAMLMVSGRLNPAIGGPGFRPFTVKVFNSSFYDLFDKDEPELNRRSVYRTGVQSAKDPLLEAFDCPEPSVKAPRRSITTTPLQALGLMNNPFVQRQAHYLAERAKREAGEDIANQVSRVYLLALSRSPTEKERDRTVNLAREHGLGSVCWVLLNSSEFLYVR